jgi:DNA-binding transcriptional MerR regulator
LTLRGKRLGFSLEEINKIIDMHDQTQPDDPIHLLGLCRKIHEYRKELLSKINDIEYILNAIDYIEEQALKGLVKRQAFPAGEQAEFDI